MTTIEQIDFSKLKPYDGKTTKSFEQLCYQIATKEYCHLGKFTPIDGSGGDGGVEFFLELDNGEKWGWQCKFYQDNGRLKQSNRKTSIENSLETACRNHDNLTKWILCLKTDLTVDSVPKNGTPRKGERNWFENSLPKKIPKDRKVLIEDWGESKLLEFLKNSKHNDTSKFFFGENADKSWLNEQFQQLSNQIETREKNVSNYRKSYESFGYIENLEKDNKIKIVSSNVEDNLLITMGEEIIIKVDQLIKTNDYKNALKILEGIIEGSIGNESSGVLYEELKLKLLIKKGIIHIRLFDKLNATHIYNILRKTYPDNKRKFEFFFEYGLTFNDNEIIVNALNWLEINTTNVEAIEIKKARCDIVKRKPFEVIKLFLVDDKLKSQYLDNAEVYHLLGFAYLLVKNYSDAQKYLSQSFAINNSFMTKFLLIESKVLPILNRPGAKFTLSHSDKIILNKKLDELNEKKITLYFKRGNLKSNYDFIRLKLSILFFLDARLALEKLDELEDSFKNEIIVKNLIADIFLFNEKYEEAKKILLELYEIDKDVEIIIKLINVYKQKGLKEDALEIFNNLSDDINDNDGRIHASILNILIDKDEKGGVSFAEDYLEKNPNAFHLYYELGLYFSKKEERDEAHRYFTKLCEFVTADNLARINLFSEDMLYYGYTDLALKIIEPFIAGDENLFKKYLKIITTAKVSAKYISAKKLIDTKLNVKPNDIDFLKIKIDLEYVSNYKNAAYKSLVKLFEKEPSASNAYNLVLLMSELGKTNYGKNAEILEKEKDSKIYIMMAAFCYHQDSNHEKAESLSYDALAINSDENDEPTYMNYLRINFFPRNKAEQDGKVDQEEINTNSAVRLTNEVSSRWIIIEEDKNIIGKAKDGCFIGGKHYHFEDTKILKILDEKINANVTFEDKNYHVAEIINRKTRAIRFCLDNVSSSEHLRKIEIDNNNPLLSIIPFLSPMEEQRVEMIGNYNFKNDIGLPIWFLSTYISPTLFDAMINVMSKPDQPFYIGDVNLIDIDSNTLIFSQTSIIMLYLYDLFDVINIINPKIVISESTYNYFEELFKEASLQDKRVSATLSFDGQRPVMNEVTNETRNARKEMFKKLLTEISKFEVKSMELSAEEYDKNTSVIKMISKHELETFHYAGNNNYTFVCDDLFVRKFYNTEYKTTNSTNILSIVYPLLRDDLDRLFDLMLKLAEGEVLYIYSTEILIEIYNKLVDTKAILGSDTLYGKFIKIIGKSLKTKTLLRYYEPILFQFIQTIYNDRFDNYSEYLIKNILKEFYKHYSLFNLDILLLKAKLKNISTSKEMAKNIFNLLSEIIEGNYN